MLTFAGTRKGSEQKISQVNLPRCANNEFLWIENLLHLEAVWKDLFLFKKKNHKIEHVNMVNIKVIFLLN